jgi:hypothetical protein
MTPTAATTRDAIGEEPGDTAAQIESAIEEMLDDGRRRAESEAETLTATGHAEDDPLESSIDQAFGDGRRRLESADAPATVQELDELLSSSARARFEQEPAVAEAGPPAAATVAMDETPATAPAAESAPVRAAVEAQDDGPGAAPIAAVIVPEAPAVGAAQATIAPAEAAAPARRGEVWGVLAWPMRPFPPAARDLIGWFALVTLFNAACIWLYLLIK